MAVDADADDDLKAVEWLIDREYALLTAWEQEFVRSLRARGIRTAAQRAKLDEIWDEVVVKRRRRPGVDARWTG